MAKEDERSRGQKPEDVNTLLERSAWRQVPAAFGSMALVLKPRSNLEGVRSFVVSTGFGLGDYYMFEGTFDLGKGPQEYELGISLRYEGLHYEREVPMWFVRTGFEKSASVKERRLGKNLARKLAHTLPPIERIRRGNRIWLWCKSAHWLQKVWDNPRTKPLERARRSRGS